MTSEAAKEALNGLIECWSYWEDYEEYYLEQLAPAIVRGTAGKLNDREVALLDELRRELSSSDWQRLPSLLRERRAALREEKRLAEERRAREEEERRREEERRAREEEEKRLAEERRAREEEERRREEARRAEQERTRQREAERRREELRLAAARRRDALLDAIDQALRTDYLRAQPDNIEGFDQSIVSLAELQRLRAAFVRDWSTRHNEIDLDNEQARAVAETSSHVQVVARAGSGKTRTIVARAQFLLRHCNVRPDELLLVAFNRKAADEMQERLTSEPAGAPPHVMTFHALAYALVHPEEELVFDDTGADQLGLSRFIQDVIDEHIHHPTTGPLIRTVMLAHFREDWEEIVRRGFDRSIEDFLAQRRSLTSESLAGDFVKSYGEKLIANTLFEHDISYAYEANYRWNGHNYRPDFLIKTGARSGVAIEYFGMQGDAAYDRQTAAKQQFWAAHQGWTLLERFPEDVTAVDAEEFSERLIHELATLGVTGSRLAEEEIWQRVARRALDRFTAAVTGFVGRCRKRNLSAEDLSNLVQRYNTTSGIERDFLQIATSIFGDYLDRLDTNDAEDFDGLMWRAVDTVTQGRTRFSRQAGRERGDLSRLKFIMIDEFQDFSEMFHELTAGILRANPDVTVFGVGDDWQAINGFAGSNLGYFDNFESYFPGAEHREITTNYRSGGRIVSVGNAIMAGRGSVSRSREPDAGEARLWLLDRFAPTEIERELHEYDEFTPAVLRIVNDMIIRDMDVVLLSRRNDVPWYVNYTNADGRQPGLTRFLKHVRSFLPEDDRDRIQISTAHKYKGLESTGVVILDAVDGSYPLIHPNWVFQQILGDTIEKIDAEERRLFYVAATRAVTALAIVSESWRQSPYLLDALRVTPVDTPDWAELKPVQPLGDDLVEIRVHDGYDVKDHLKTRGYRWVSSGRYWAKSVAAEVFDVDLLRSQSWTNAGYSIEVWSSSGDRLHHLNR